MKKIFFIMLIILAAIQTSGFGQKKGDRFKLKADPVTTDSVEYELIIIDPGFDSWLVTQPPIGFHSKEYYELKNNLYVVEWNQRYFSFPDKELYETYIDYKFNIDYGLELNYKLYYYFRYFEQTNHVNLINSVR